MSEQPKNPNDRVPGPPPGPGAKPDRLTEEEEAILDAVWDEEAKKDEPAPKPDDDPKKK